MNHKLKSWQQVIELSLRIEMIVQKSIWFYAWRSTMKPKTKTFYMYKEEMKSKLSTSSSRIPVSFTIQY